MAMSREHKTILITGASRGIGAGLAEGFAARGWNLVMIYSRSDGQMGTTARRIADTTGLSADRLRVFRVNVADRAAVRGVFDEAVGLFGGVDALVNNAGINN